MSTDNGWPDPARPGVPLNPERDGWHIIGWQHADDADTYVVRWQPDWPRQRASIGPPCPGYQFGGYGPFLSVQGAARYYRYIGPMLTPEEVAAREAAAAEAMREASADKVRDKAVQLANAGAVTLSEEWHEVSVVIRALPLPDPDALARAIQAVVAAEREACAEIVAFWPTGITTAAQEQIAAAIRARKDKT